MSQTFPNTAPTRGTYDWLRLRVGMFLRNELGEPALGTDIDYGNWDSFQEGVVDEIIQSGLFQFYFPPALPGQKVPYEWSFLKIGAQIATANTDFDYDLPSDFGGIADDFTWTTGDDKTKPKLVSPEAIMAKRGKAANTGTPEFIAIRPKSSTGSAAQGFEAIVYPTPSAVETLEYRYLAVPPVLNSTNSYPFGALSHAETIAASCLAAAEQYWRGTSGPQRGYFMERLRASMNIDARGNSLSDDNVRDLMESREHGIQATRNGE